MASRRTSPKSISILKTQKGCGEPSATKTLQSARSPSTFPGDKVHKSSFPNTSHATERQLCNDRNSEPQLVYETLAKVKGQLASEEQAKVQVLGELAHIRALTDELSIKLNEMVQASERERSRAKDIEQASFTAAEDWQAELEALKKQHEEQVSSLQIAKQELENLKQELLTSIDAKNKATKLVGEAMSAAEISAKKVEELTTELKVAKSYLITAESTSSEVYELVNELEAAKSHLAEAYVMNEKHANEIASTVAAKEDSIKEMSGAFQQAKAENEALKQEIALAKELDVEIKDKQEIMENLRFELAVAKDMESKSSSAIADAHSELVKTKVELEQAQMAETESLESLASVTVELEETRENLRCKSEKAATLTASLRFMHFQLEKNEAEVADVKDRVLGANVKISDLTRELYQLQKQLADAVTAEEEARSTIKNLSISLQELRVESEQAKQELLWAKSEAEREGEKVVAAQVELHLTTEESQVAREMIAKVKAATMMALARANEVEVDVAGIRAEAGTAEYEAERANEEAKRASIEAVIAKEKALISLKELQVVQDKVQEAKVQVQMERRQSSCARDEAQEALSRAMELEAELKNAQLEATEAEVAANTVLRKLHDAMREMETANEASDSTVDLGKKDASETWVTAENEPIVITIPQEEYENTKLKLHEAEASVKATRANLAAIEAKKEELSQRLELVYKEMEVGKLGALQAHRQLEDAEKAKHDLEGELQKLRFDFEQRKNREEMAPKAPLDSGIIGSPKLESAEEEKLMLTSTGMPVLQKVDNHSELALSLTSRKKKKATLLKIASFFSKAKKH